MSEWLGIALFLFLAIILVGARISAYSDGRKVSDAYQSLSSQSGLTFTEGHGTTIASLAGVYKGRVVNLTAKMIIHRSGDTTYTEIQTHIDNPQNIKLSSGELAKYQLINPVAKLKSGDPIFDSTYRLYGSPAEVVLKLLHSAEVRSAMKSLAPPNAPIFSPPHFQLESSKFMIRSYMLYSNAEQLQKFLEKVWNFATLIEAGVAEQIPNQSPQTEIQ